MFSLVFRIGGNNIDFDDITNNLQFDDIHCCRKGDISEKYNIKTVCEEDVWQARIICDNLMKFQAQIDSFVEKLRYKQEYVQKISECYSASVWLTIYTDDVQNNIHFSSEVLRIISSLGVSLNISIMNLKQFY